MSLISGEYWIDDSGNTTFADGDVGDAGHELIAFEAALGLDLESLRGIQFYPGGMPTTELAEKYLEDKESEITLDDLSDMEPKDQVALVKKLGVESKYLELEPEDALAHQWLDDNGANMKFVEWCESSHCDARDYALESMGWIRVKNDDFETWELNDDSLKRIIGSDVFPEEDNDGYSIEDSEAEVGLSERKTGWYESIPVRVLLKAKSAEGLKRYIGGVGKFHRSGGNPKGKKRCKRRA